MWAGLDIFGQHNSGLGDEGTSSRVSYLFKDNLALKYVYHSNHAWPSECLLRWERGREKPLVVQVKVDDFSGFCDLVDFETQEIQDHFGFRMK